jgi:hypothetical protein
MNWKEWMYTSFGPSPGWSLTLTLTLILKPERLANGSNNQPFPNIQKRGQNQNQIKVPVISGYTHIPTLTMQPCGTSALHQRDNHKHQDDNTTPQFTARAKELTKNCRQVYGLSAQRAEGTAPL